MGCWRTVSGGLEHTWTCLALGFIAVLLTLLCVWRRATHSRPADIALQPNSSQNASSVLRDSRRSPMHSPPVTSQDRHMAADDVITQHADASTKRNGQLLGIGGRVDSMNSLSRSDLSLDSIQSPEQAASPSPEDDDLKGVENAEFFFFSDVIISPSDKKPEVSREETNVTTDAAAPKRRLSQVLQTSVMARMLVRQRGGPQSRRRRYRRNSRACEVKHMQHRAAQRWAALQTAYDELLREDMAPLKMT
ncbi:hypothetical protein CAPTEDRAFT_201546 [Capitella teleta]|uniref:Transmembrane protein n=1 Tax=Capitella teleta TaxID=283909 RepID=R7UHI3_CAPTE|nr:hypothetical protein CAPTEDRAFT_201546 [Capitella teleta]|eukprot:ELU02732.1 hypothetical protein CAPTEDRAFT_201546 [Capitella teleta]